VDDGVRGDSPARAESTTTSALHLQKHIEGGYFAEIDPDPLRIPNPFHPNSDSTRSASTTIHYFLSPSRLLGAFYPNKGRTVHTYYRGRARYVIIYADEVAASSHPHRYGDDGVQGQRRIYRTR